MKGRFIMFSIQNFFNNTFGFAVRGALINGVPYVSGSDVAKCLGYNNTNKAVRQHVFDEYKNASPIWAGIPNMVFISEPGIYQLIFSSKMPKALDFQRWVFEEVLPKLRQDEIAELKEDNTMLRAQVKALNSKAGYYNKTLYSDSFNTATNIASDYGITAYEFNRLLANLGIQYKSGNRWYLSRKYVGCGYTTVRTTHDENGNEIEFMAWTNIGLIFIQEVLYEYYGMVPRSQVPPWDFVVPEEYEEDGVGNSDAMKKEE